MKKRIIAILVILVVIVSLLMWNQYRRIDSKISGFVEADEIRLGSRVGGRVQRVLIEEGDKVKASQTLVELEPFDLLHLLEQAQANLAVARANSSYAKSNMENVNSSFERGAATIDEQEKATQSYASSVASIQAAESAIKVIESQIDELTIESPCDGVVDTCNLKAGDIVSPNAPALTMLADGTLYIRSFIPEDRLLVKPGMEVQVSTDSLPGWKFSGKVTYIARQAEFTPNNIQTTEKRAEQVFRIKVKMADGLDVLRPGMPVDVWLPENYDATQPPVTGAASSPAATSQAATSSPAEGAR